MKKLSQKPRKVEPEAPENDPLYRGFKSYRAFIEPVIEEPTPLLAGRSSQKEETKKRNEPHRPPKGGRERKIGSDALPELQPSW